MEATRQRPQQIAIEAIRGQIRSGLLEPGSPIPSETQLAETLEISRGTIRKAIETLIESGEVTRRPYSRPRVGERRISPPVGGTEVHVWISHPIADGATLQFLRGVSNGLMGTNLQLVVREPTRFFAEHVKKDERQFLLDFLNNDSAVRAIVERDAHAGNDDLYLQAVESGRHIVFVDTPPPPGVPADYVGTANSSASRLCAEHLIQQGHSNIVFVSESDAPYTVQQRISGYKRAMDLAGIAEYAKVLIASHMEPATGSRLPHVGQYARCLAPSPYYNDRCARIMRALSTIDPAPTAILASCDVLALWLAAVLESSGARIPEDYAIVGFDYLARWDSRIADVLTTASQDFEGFGFHAAEFLLDRDTDGPKVAARQILLPAPMVLRASTLGELSHPGSEPSQRAQHFR